MSKKTDCHLAREDTRECPTCKGRGRLIVSSSPSGDAEMDCWQCCGEGRVDGSLPPLPFKEKPHG